MMELPKDGKVVIVDDCRTEIEPLIDVLSKKGYRTYITVECLMVYRRNH